MYIIGSYTFEHETELIETDPHHEESKALHLIQNACLGLQDSRVSSLARIPRKHKLIIMFLDSCNLGVLH